MKSITFLIQCPDHKGLLAKITDFFYREGFNILHCHQYTDIDHDQYFMRIKLDMNDLYSSRKDLERKFDDFGSALDLKWSAHYSDYTPRIGIMVSKTPHCLYDLILRQKEGALNCEIPIIISNHPDLEYVSEQFKIPFYCQSINKDKQAEQEDAVLNLMRKHHVDLIVLARYMRILSENFINQYPERIINIHHAFLPAFQGANPYARAHERGVKMIGATAHYATAELDQGPIIEQNVGRVTHEDTINDLKRIGRDLECAVLAKAVREHIENRVIVFQNRCVVFSNGV